jgi:hypothetical protein
MFWKKKDDQGPKLPGPRDVPEIVKKVPEFIQKIEPGTIPYLKAVIKSKEQPDKAFDIRIFDPSEAEAGTITVKNYDSLNDNANLIIAEGWYSDATKKAELNVKRSIPALKLLTLNEILVQVEGLKEPGSNVFFYTAAGPSAGGPLGRGCAIVKLNANTEDKKQKKYSIYSAAVINMQPTPNESRVWDSDKTKDIARWVSEAHKPRFC